MQFLQYLGLFPLVLLAGAVPQEQRAPSSAQRFLSELDLGTDAVIADVGAGHSRLCFQFAACVPDGHVIAEDIEEPGRSWERARPHGLENVTYLVGTEQDTMLSPGMFDLVYTMDALHEFVHVESMMASIQRALKPGGYFAAIDYNLGPTRERVLFAEREDQHAFVSETILSRLAWEAGLVYDHHSEVLFDLGRPWSGFNVVFRKPELGERREFQPIDIVSWGAAIDLPETGRIGVAALPPSRDAFVAWLESRGEAVEVVELGLDEWLLPGEGHWPPKTSIPWTTVRTWSGVPEKLLPTLDAFLFVDAFHSLYFEEVLLGILRHALKAGAPLYVLDRRKGQAGTRMQYTMWRGLSPLRVKKTVESAGFRVESTQGTSPGGAHTFLLRATPPETRVEPPAILSRDGWKRVFKRAEFGKHHITVIGDDASLDDSLLEEMGLTIAVHASMFGWEGVTGAPNNHQEVNGHVPYPSCDVDVTGMFVVPDYDRLSDPRLPLHTFSILVMVLTPGARLDGLPDTSDEMEAYFAALGDDQFGITSFEVVRGEEVGCPDKEVWILKR